ncbi:MAG: MFS transporter, partial [Verrucomicrobiota bacterium]
ARVYFVWVGVFNLFAVTLFWSFLADVFSPAQGKRLFAFVAAGGSLGAIAGSAIATSLIDAWQVPIALLLLIPVVCLELCTQCAGRLHRGDHLLTNASEAEKPAGGSVVEGFLQVLRSPYLLAICSFLLLGKLCATTIYFYKISVISENVLDEGARTALFSKISLATNILALILQFVVTRHIIRKGGLGVALCILPLIYLIFFLTLGFKVSLPIIVVIAVLHRSIHFGLTNPAREILFTVVSKSEKYKAKSFIDTAIFRGGDTAASWIYKGLSGSLGMGIAGISLLMAPIALFWVGLAWKLGSWANGKSATTQTPDGLS